MARITVGNTKVAGFVNLVKDGRFLIGTGSYQDKGGNKVYKESVTVFLEPAYDGIKPVEGDYVEVRGDLVVAPRKDKPEEMSASMNLRFANQVEKLQAPTKKEAAAPAGAGNDDI